MSSDDDSDSTKQSQTCNKLFELLKLRAQTQQGHDKRKLYDDIPHPTRRSLNVQKLCQKEVVKVVDKPVFEEHVHDVSMRDNNQIPKTSVSSPQRTQGRAHQKLIACSTPMVKDKSCNFTSSFSPVKHISVIPIFNLIEPVFTDQNPQNNNIPSVPLSLSEFKVNTMQPKVVLTDVLNTTRRRNTSTVQAEIIVPEPPKRSVRQANKIKSKFKPIDQELTSSAQKTIMPKTGQHELTKVVKRNSEFQFKSFSSSASSENSAFSKTVPKSSTANREISNASELRLSSRYLGNSETNGSYSGFQNKELSSKSVTHKSSDLRSNSSSKNVTKRNSELLNVNSKRSKSLTRTLEISSFKSKQATEIPDLMEQTLRDCSVSPDIDSLIVIPETEEDNDEMESENSISANKMPSNHIEILNIENIQTPSQVCRDDPRLAGIYSSSSVLTQSVSNTQRASHKPPSKRARKKKINNNYLNFLNLEKSVNRRSANSSSKRKLYSSEMETQKLAETKDSDTDSKPRRSKKTITPTITQATSVMDSDGFKIPNTPNLTTKPYRTRKTDTPCELVTSELGVIAENIRILNESKPAEVSNKTLQIEPITKTPPPPKPAAKPKGSKSGKNLKPKVSKIVQKIVVEDTTGIRRSTRVKNEPMTFWKVHKEPITVYQTKFYNQMISKKSRPVQKKQNKAQPPVVSEIVEPLSQEPGSSNAQEVEPPSIPPSVSPNGNSKNLQMMQIEEINVNSRPPVPYTLPQPTTGDRHLSDSAIQETTESDDQTNPHIKFLKKFDKTVKPNHQRSTQLGVENEFLHIDNFDFKIFSEGIEFSFVRNTNEMLGFMRLQPGAKKQDSRTSRKYFLTLMLFTDSSVTIKINQNFKEMALGELDTIQLPPDCNYALTNNSTTKPAILMIVRTRVKSSDKFSSFN